MLSSRNMLLLVLVTQALFLISTPAHEVEATNMMKKNQVLGPLKAQGPPISLPVPNSPTTGDTRISEKAFASDFPLLRRELLKGYTHPSAPSPDTYIPASTGTLANHNAAPAPAPLPEFPLLGRELLKGYTQPSAPNPDTYIPASTGTSANHNAAPAPAPAPVPLPEFPLLGRKLLKGYTQPSAPNPYTYIPASTKTLANHNAAPAPAPLPGSC